MRIHTDAPDTAALCLVALTDAKAAGKISPDVEFDQLKRSNSRSHRSAADVHLVSYTGGKGTEHNHRPNSGTYGADGREDVWAATYDEWGWFLSYVYAADATAKTSADKTVEAFDARTEGKYSSATATA